MPFNSSALSAGIGTMLQGIQESAQQKLQLAEMERRRRIEDENLKHQRAMEELTRERGAFQFGEEKKTAPLTLRDLTTRVTLGEKLAPSQIRSAELGVEGQGLQNIGLGLANKERLFNLDNVLPSTAKQAAAAAKLAEGTVDSNITAAKQATQANTFGAVNTQKAGMLNAVAQIQKAKSILSNPMSSYQDKMTAYNEYNTNQKLLQGHGGFFALAKQFPDLFGDVSAVRGDFIRGLGGTADHLADPNTDIDKLIGTFAPTIASPTMSGPERYKAYGTMISSIVNSIAQNPSADIARDSTYKFNTKTGRFEGAYSPATFDLGKVINKSLPAIKTQIATTATQIGATPMQVYKELGVKTFDKNGQPNDKELAAALKPYVSMGDVSKPWQAYEADYGQARQQQVQAYLGQLQKDTGIKIAQKQYDAAIAGLQAPAVNMFQETYKNALSQLADINKQLADMNVIPSKLATIATYADEVRMNLQGEALAKFNRLVDMRHYLANGIQQSMNKFVDLKNGDAASRANTAIKELTNISNSPVLAPSAPAVGGAAPASTGFGISPTTQIDPPNFGSGLGARPLQ
jgi:hypothetical protein